MAEHGPDTDDELNVLVPGGNFGWPNVAGLRDDKAYVYANWSEAPETLRYTGRDIPPEVPQYPESEFDQEIVEPIATYWTVESDYDFAGGCGWICNPTIAPGSIQHYSAGDAGIFEWDNSVLIPTLKHGTLYVQHLTEDGRAADGLPTAWFHTQNRYRDVAMAPDNTRVFIATDGFGTASEIHGDTGFTNVLHNPGAILLFTYVGAGGAGQQQGAVLSPSNEAADQNLAEQGPTPVEGDAIAGGEAGEGTPSNDEQPATGDVAEAAPDPTASDDAVAIDRSYAPSAGSAALSPQLRRLSRRRGTGRPGPGARRQ